MIRFVSAGAAHGLVTALAARDEAIIEGHFGAVGAMLEKFRAGEPCDVVILTDRQIAELVGEGRALGETVTDLGTVATSIAVRAEESAPDLSDGNALRRALIAADAIYFPDPSKATAGIHFAKVIDELGIRSDVEARLRIFPNGSTAMREMAAAPGHPIGCTQATEILATPGARLAGPLPRGFELETVYTAAVGTRARDAAAARTFVASIGDESSRALRAHAGFQGFTIHRAMESEFAEIRRIVERVLGEYSLVCDPQGTDGDLADIASSYFARGGTFEVATDAQGTIAGCCGVYPIDPGTCELRKMYILDSARGIGLGARFLRRALAFARGQGFRRIELETASVLKDAIALYTREGFRPIERAHLAGRCDQAYARDL